MILIVFGIQSRLWAFSLSIAVGRLTYLVVLLVRFLVVEFLSEHHVSLVVVE